MKDRKRGLEGRSPLGSQLESLSAFPSRARFCSWRRTAEEMHHSEQPFLASLAETARTQVDAVFMSEGLVTLHGIRTQILAKDRRMGLKFMG